MALGSSIVGNLIVRVTADVNGVATGFAKIRSDMEGLQLMGAKMQAIGGLMTMGLTVPIVGLGAASVASFMEIQKGYNTIIAQTGATGEKLAGLKHQFEGLYGTLPQDSTDIATTLATVYDKLGQMGAPVQALSADIMNLSRMTGENSDKMSQDISQMMIAWNVPSSQMENKTKELYNIFTSTHIPITKLTQDLDANKAVFSQANMTWDESISMIAMLDNAGENNSNVVRGMAMGWGNLAKNLDNGNTVSKSFTDTWAHMQSEVGKSGGSLKSTGDEMQVVFKGIADGLITESDASKIFGSRYAAYVVDAIRSGKMDYDTFLKNVNSTPDAFDKAAKSSLTFGQGLTIVKHDMELALSPLGGSIVNVFESMLPTIQALIGMVGGLMNGFAGLSPPIQTAVILIGGMLAALGPVVFLLGSMLTAWDRVQKSISGVGTAVTGLKPKTQAQKEAYDELARLKKEQDTLEATGASKDDLQLNKAQQVQQRGVLSGRSREAELDDPQRLGAERAVAPVSPTSRASLEKEIAANKDYEKSLAASTKEHEGLVNSLNSGTLSANAEKDAIAKIKVNEEQANSAAKQHASTLKEIRGESDGVQKSVAGTAKETENVKDKATEAVGAQQGLTTATDKTATKTTKVATESEKIKTKTDEATKAQDAFSTATDKTITKTSKVGTETDLVKTKTGEAVVEQESLGTATGATAAKTTEAKVASSGLKTNIAEAAGEQSTLGAAAGVTAGEEGAIAGETGVVERNLAGAALAQDDISVAAGVTAGEEGTVALETGVVERNLAGAALAQDDISVAAGVTAGEEGAVALETGVIQGNLAGAAVEQSAVGTATVATAGQTGLLGRLTGLFKSNTAEAVVTQGALGEATAITAGETAGATAAVEGLAGAEVVAGGEAATLAGPGALGALVAGGPILIGIALIVGAGVLLYTQWTPFKNLVDGLVTSLTTGAATKWTVPSTAPSVTPKSSESDKASAAALKGGAKPGEQVVDVPAGQHYDAVLQRLVADDPNAKYNTGKADGSLSIPGAWNTVAGAWNNAMAPQYTGIWDEKTQTYTRQQTTGQGPTLPLASTPLVNWGEAEKGGPLDSTSGVGSWAAGLPGWAGRLDTRLQGASTASHNWGQGVQDTVGGGWDTLLKTNLGPFNAPTSSNPTTLGPGIAAAGSAMTDWGAGVPGWANRFPTSVSNWAGGLGGWYDRQSKGAEGLSQPGQVISDWAGGLPGWAGRIGDRFSGLGNVQAPAAPDVGGGLSGIGGGISDWAGGLGGWSNRNLGNGSPLDSAARSVTDPLNNWAGGLGGWAGRAPDSFAGIGNRFTNWGRGIVGMGPVAPEKMPDPIGAAQNFFGGLKMPGGLSGFGGMGMADPAGSIGSMLSGFKMPDFKMPEFKMPDFKIPEFKMPDFKIPEFKMPEFKMPDFKMPDFKMPDFKIPDMHWPDLPKLDLSGLTSWVPNLSALTSWKPDLSGITSWRPDVGALTSWRPDFSVLTGWLPNFSTLTGWIPNFSTLTSWVPNFSTLTSWVPNFSTLTSWIPNFSVLTSFGWPQINFSWPPISMPDWWHLARGAITGGISAAGSTVNRAVAAAAPIINPIESAVQTGENWLGGIGNSISSGFHSIFGANGLKTLASGGLEGAAWKTSGPQVAVIGEAGPEAVIPQKYWSGIQPWVLDALPKLAGGATSGGALPTKTDMAMGSQGKGGDINFDIVMQNPIITSIEQADELSRRMAFKAREELWRTGHAKG